MKKLQTLVAGIIFFTLCVAAMASPSIVGKWKGKIDIDWAKMAGKASPDKIAAAKKQVASIKLVLEFKADKTFSSTGGPMGPMNGSWTETGTTVALSTAKSKTKQQFTLSKNGKTMTTSAQGGAFKLTLTKD